MTDLRNLNRAVQNAEFPSHEWAQAVREWIDKATEKMEPKRWRCDRCRAPLGDDEGHRDKATGDYSCKIAMPASEGAKVETTADRIAADLAAGTFRGAQPEPAAKIHPPLPDGSYYRDSPGGQRDRVLPEPAAPVGEMPEVVRDAVEWLRAEARSWEHDAPNSAGRARSISDALESFWRTHAAQPKVADMYGYIKCELDDLLGSCGAIVALEGVPLHWKFAAEIRDKAKALAAKVEIADVSRRTGFSPPAAQPKVAMTEELERVLCFAERKANGTESRVVFGEVLADIAAVRTQASQPVKLAKVRALLNELEPMDWPSGEHAAALAELDAAEGLAK